MIFEKNPFTTAVSIPKSFHLTPFSPTFEIHQPTLVINICKILVEEYFLEIKRSFKKSILIMFQNVWFIFHTLFLGVEDKHDKIHFALLFSACLSDVDQHPCSSFLVWGAYARVGNTEILKLSISPHYQKFWRGTAKWVNSEGIDCVEWAFACLF